MGKWEKMGKINNKVIINNNIGKKKISIINPLSSSLNITYPKSLDVLQQKSNSKG